MSSRTELRDRIRDNLDDTSSVEYRFSTVRVNRVMEQKRREVFDLQSTLNPGHYYQTYEDLTIVSGTREYLLQNGVEAIARVEWIAENGTAMDKPIPITKIDFSEIDWYISENSGNRGGTVYYTFKGLSVGIPLITIGILPDPNSNGEDIRVHEYVNPYELTDLAWDPTAGSGLDDDDNESGLEMRWEDLLVVRATITLLNQRPPAVGSKTIDYWQDEERKILAVVAPRSADRVEQDSAGYVNYTERE